MKAHIPSRSVVVFGALVVLALFVRLFWYSHATYFSGDQGSLLLVADRMLRNHIFPYAGPAITAQEVHIPTYNYYLVAFLLWITHGVPGVIMGYVLMNLLTMVGLFLLVRRIFGDAAALWSGAFFAVSYVMIDYARSIWEPHPIPFLIVLSLVFIWRALKEHSWVWLCNALIFFSLAGALYIAALILLPYYIYQVSRWDAKVTKAPAWRSWVYGAVVTVGFVILPWLPFIQIVRSSGLLEPVVLNKSFVLPALPRLWELGYTRLWLIVNSLFRFNAMGTDIGPLQYLLAGALFWLVGMGTYSIAGRVWKTVRTNESWKFVGLPWLAVGFLCSLLYTGKIYWYHFGALYPFFFILIGVLMARLWTHRGYAHKAIAGAVVAVYLIGNGTLWWWTTVQYPYMEYPNAQAVARFVQKDTKSRDVGMLTYAVHFFSPLDEWDYDATPLWYLLRQQDVYRVTFSPLGNELVRGDPEPQEVNTVYLVCSRYRDAVRPLPYCLSTYQERNPEFQKDTQVQVAPKTVVVVYTRRTSGK